LQGGKDESQITSKHKKRPRTSVASSETGNSAVGLRFSLNGDQTAASGDTSNGLAASSSTGNDGGKDAENCLAATALASGDAVNVNPLSVETQFSESPAGPVSGGSTTDTASEVASLIHSPGESSSVSTVDSSFEGRLTKSAEDDASDEHGQLDDRKADLDNRLAVAAQALACEDARSSVLNTIVSDHAACVKTSDSIPLPDGDATDGEISQKLNGDKCPPRFSNKVCTAFLLSSIVYVQHSLQKGIMFSSCLPCCLSVPLAIPCQPQHAGCRQAMLAYGQHAVHAGESIPIPTWSH